MPTVLQTILAVVFAALGFVGFWVSIHPPSTRRWRWFYLGVFVLLTVLGVVLVFWQAKFAERSQLAADNAANELRQRVAVLYRLQTAASRRPTQEEIDGLAERAGELQRQEKSRTYPDLALKTQLLAAEMRLFAAERAKAAPRVETMPDVSQDVSGRVDDMESRSSPTSRSEDELLDWANGRFLSIYFGPSDQVGLTEAEKRWFARNKDAVVYQHATIHLFEEKFGRRLTEVVDELHKAGAVDERFKREARFTHSPIDRTVRELVFRLEEAADRLLRRFQGY